MNDQLDQGGGNDFDHVPGADAGGHIRGGSLADAARGAPAAAIGGTAAVDVVALARGVLAFGPPQMTWSAGAWGASGAPGAPGAPGVPGAPGAPARTPPRGTPAVVPAMRPTATAAFLTVEQYALLCVDLELRPLDAAAVLRRHGISTEQKRALDEDWAYLFATQPARRSTFEHAKSAYRAWLARSGRQ